MKTYTETSRKMPNNLPYRKQVMDCINGKDNFGSLLRQLKTLNSKNKSIIEKSIKNETRLTVMVPVKDGGKLIGIDLEDFDTIDEKLDWLSEDYKANTKILILENWLKNNNLI